MTTWALIPCTKTKAKVACTAREMYWPSALFRGAWRVAVARGESPLILSAKHGLLHPETVIQPYDETLLGKSKEWRQTWATAVLVEMGRIVLPGDRIVSYLGATYAEYILPELRVLGLPVDEPLKGKGQGQRLAWFKQNGGAA